jgi:hypothetical protein
VDVEMSDEGISPLCFAEGGLCPHESSFLVVPRLPLERMGEYPEIMQPEINL